MRVELGMAVEIHSSRELQGANGTNNSNSSGLSGSSSAAGAIVVVATREFNTLESCSRLLYICTVEIMVLDCRLIIVAKSAEA